MTDFTTTYPLPVDLPNARQAGGDHPSRVWDGNGIDTAYVWNDVSGKLSEIRHVGSDGTIVWSTSRPEYGVFGKPYYYDMYGNNIGHSTWGNRFLFTGREWLSDLQIYDYRHRMYQPELGRFLQPDPKQFEGGDYNLYRYCHNDPVNHTDPTGLDLRIDSFQPYDVQVKIQAIIDRVSQTPEGAAAIQTMRDSPFDNVILGTLPGLDSSESTIARNGANQNNGVGSGAIITIPTSDTVNVRSDGTKETLPPSVPAGHGFGHGASINKGTQPPVDPNAKGADYIKQPSESKSDSIKVENAVRKLEKLKERD